MVASKRMAAARRRNSIREYRRRAQETEELIHHHSIDRWSRAELVQYLNAHGIGFDSNATLGDLRQAVADEMEDYVPWDEGGER